MTDDELTVGEEADRRGPTSSGSTTASTSNCRCWAGDGVPRGVKGVRVTSTTARSSSSPHGTRTGWPRTGSSARPHRRRFVRPARTTTRLARGDRRARRHAVPRERLRPPPTPFDATSWSGSRRSSWPAAGGRLRADRRGGRAGPPGRAGRAPRLDAAGASAAGCSRARSPGPASNGYPAITPDDLRRRALERAVLRGARFRRVRRADAGAWQALRDPGARRRARRPGPHAASCVASCP